MGFEHFTKLAIFLGDRFLESTISSVGSSS